MKKREMFYMALSISLLAAGMVFEKALHEMPFSIGEYLVFGASYLLSGRRVIIRAVKNLVHGQFFDESFLMTIATIGAFAIHQLEEAVGVMIFFQVGEFFQDLALGHSRGSIKALLDVQPKTAHLKTEEGLTDAEPEEVIPGQVIVVKPGEKVPLDGVILSGTSQVDTSPLTGEHVPRVVRPKDTVLAGMINSAGSLTVKVTKPYRESSISKIMHLVEKAIEKKSRSERFITRFARVYSPAVVAAAFMIAVLPPLLIQGERFSDWIYRALVLMVISCPCAFVISIPLGYFGGIGMASRRGVLIKGASFLDSLNEIEDVVFDKTGTLTEGTFQVKEVVPTAGFTKTELLRWASEAESHSEHPIARSICGYYGKKIDPHSIQSYSEKGGLGVEAKVRNRRVLVGNDRLLHRENIPHDACHIEGTVVHVAVGKRYAGHIVIGDTLKRDAAASVRELRELGVKKIGMLTGDNSDAARYAASALALDFYFSDLLPEEKVKTLEELMDGRSRAEQGAYNCASRGSSGAMNRARGTTAFVGDGINDAPVIARADIGIAMGSIGSDAAIETADIVLMTDSPAKVAEAVRIARKTRSIVWQNIMLALAVKAVFMGLGAGGIATMWEAVFADMGVALLAIFNSVRILR